MASGDGQEDKDDAVKSLSDLIAKSLKKKHISAGGVTVI
jgi:hypothetical protein